MRAVRFDRYGGVDVLEVRDVDDPVAAEGRVVVEVRAAGVNPGEMAIREGFLHDRWPATFPSGQGSDLAGVVVAVGDGETSWKVGDEVLGFSHERSSHAELVAVPWQQLVAKPAGTPWEVAGSLYVAGVTGAIASLVVAPQAGEVVVVSAAAGGVGGVAAQMSVRAGATVIGLASERHHDWLRSRGVVPVAYGDGQEQRIRRAAGERPIAAFIDTFGRGTGAATSDGYMALAVALGVPASRIETVIDFAGAAEIGANAVGGDHPDPRPILTELAGLVATGDLDVPIAATYPLEQVRDAYRDVERRHTRGKIVLLP
ncbi:NADP-dependent oxidoreductase [Desertimonas flava]|uniref:NADP-dependent oxidoreductase n=1 Tax=Desertimonas flava TaxID=2064846 RepID=UPI000E34CB94|nr:NADP-dependent oxidoreductase [Desertimonas flava]